MSKINIGDIVVYRNKCMNVIKVDEYEDCETEYEIKDIVTRDIYTAHADEISKTDRCLDSFYKLGEID